MQFIFTCASGDIAFCTEDYLQKITDRMRQLGDRTFLLQTKDPSVFHKVSFPENVILGITLETNRDELCQTISKAPPPSQRYEVFKSISHPQKMVTIEPVMDFDLDVLLPWLEEINSCMIWIGYDSRNTGLPEPELAKVRSLHWELARRGFVVMLKTIRESNCADSSDWDRNLIENWAENATPNSRLAMWILANGHEYSVAQLNAAAVSAGLNSANGSIVGGINAAAKRHEFPHVVTTTGDGPNKTCVMRHELRPLFREVLEGYPEAAKFSEP